VNFDYFVLKIDRDAAGKLIRLGFPLMVTVLLSWGINLADRFLINSILNDHQQVAIYNFAATIGRIPYFIIVAPFAVAWATVMFNIAKMENPLDRFREYFTFFVALNLLCGSALLLFRKELLYLLAKNDYASGLNMISWFILGSTFGGLYSFWTFGPALKGRSREYVFPALFSALVTILGNSLLLRYYGIIGGAYTYLVANFIMAYIMYYICQKWYPISYDWAKVNLIFLIFIFIWMANENIVIFLNNTARILGQALLFVLFLAICWNMTLRKLYILSFSSSPNSMK
jgi:O-antigen/teichoic acid export membrane protein